MMTESEWLSSTNPEVMLEDLIGAPGATKESVIRSPLASDRKLRLLAVAAYRLWYSNPKTDKVILAGEQMADRLPYEKPKETPNYWHVMHHDSAVAARRAISDSGHAKPRVAPIVRDIFGNPHRPLIRVSPQGIYLGIGILAPDAPWQAWHQAWSTRDVYAIAESMYESRDFSDAPYLADALEDVGCDIEDAIKELRGLIRCPGCLGKGRNPTDKTLGLPRLKTGQFAPLVCQVCNGKGWKAPDIPLGHVRGNWVVDLVLGKE